MKYTHLQLMTMQASALYRHENGDIIAFNGPPEDPGKAPWLFIGRTKDGCIIRFHPQVTCDIRQQILHWLNRDKYKLDYQENLYYEKEIIELVRCQGLPIDVVWSGPVYNCSGNIKNREDVVAITSENLHICKKYFSHKLPWLKNRPPAFAAVENGQAVSICYCATQHGQAIEAGVDTHSNFRKKGYGSEVVAAWIQAVRLNNCIPLYSTGWHNRASQRIASKLGLQLFGSDFHIRQQ